MVIGERNTQINYFYGRTVTDGVAPLPLADVHGVIDSPYRGLAKFEEWDAAFFFGREAAATEVLERISLLARKPGLLVVSGVSGAGKSSLVRAGVLPRIRGGGLALMPEAKMWPAVVVTPEAAPLDELATRVATLAGTDAVKVRNRMAADPAGFAFIARQAALNASDGRADGEPAPLATAHEGRLLLVIDQFEQIFTCSEAEQRAFISALHAAATVPHGPAQAPAALVVLVVRADFEARCADFPLLETAVKERYLVTAMKAAELRMAITEPARRVDSRVDDALVKLLLEGAGAQATESSAAATGVSAGVLPLLSHALDQAWRDRTGKDLTQADYARTGGIEGAVARSAEDAYKALTPAQKVVARLTFTQLTAVSSDGSDTTRRADRAELLHGKNETEASEVEAVLEVFAAKRLLTLAAGTVEISHEVLLTAWPLLRDNWLADTHTDRIVWSRLRSTASEWDSHHRDTSYLYYGSLLETAAEAVARISASPGHHLPIGEAEQDFLRASQVARRRRARVRTAVITGLAALVMIASGTAVVAFQQQDEALRQRDLAIVDRVTAEADRLRETDSATAAQLDMVAYQMQPTADLRTQLMAEAGSVLPAALPDFSGSVSSVAFGPGGQLATGAGTLQIWDASDPTRPAPLTSALSAGEGIAVRPIAYSSQGGLLARGGSDGTIRILDASDARHPIALSAPVAVGRGTVVSLKFSPDNRMLALGTASSNGSTTSGTVQLWSVADPRSPRRLSTVMSVQEQTVSSVAFSPDGTTLAVGGGTATGAAFPTLLQLWDVRNPARPAPLGLPLGGHTKIVNQVAFSPAGGLMATAGSDNRVLVWDVSNRTRPRVKCTLFLGSVAASVAFSPDGRVLATGENAGTIDLWNVGDPGNTRILSPSLRGHTSTVSSLAFDATGRTLASGGGDGRTLLWQLPPTMTVVSGGQAVNAMAVTTDGRLLAVASGTHVTLWDVSDPARLSYLGALPAFLKPVQALAFRPRADGTSLLATGGDSVRLWDVSAPSHPAPVGTALPGQTKPVSALAFDADGRTLVASSMILQGGYVGGLRAWDVSTPTRPTALGSELDSRQSPIRGMSAAPEGGYVYTGDIFGVVHVWRTGSGAVPSPGGQVPSAQAIFGLAADPHARLIATANGDGRIRLWDVSRPQSPTAVGPPLLAGGIVVSVGFAPDGLLASGDALGQIRLWDTSDPAHAVAYGLPISGHGGWVNALLFSPSGGLLISGGEEGTVRLWQSDTARARAILCASTRTVMTPALWKQYVSPALPYHPPCAE